MKVGYLFTHFNNTSYVEPPGAPSFVIANQCLSIFLSSSDPCSLPIPWPRPNPTLHWAQTLPCFDTADRSSHRELLILNFLTSRRHSQYGSSSPLEGSLLRLSRSFPTRATRSSVRVEYRRSIDSEQASSLPLFSNRFSRQFFESFPTATV